MEAVFTKLELAFPVKGKRGGARVITNIKIEDETVTLATIYDRSEKEDLTPNELKALLHAFSD